MYVMLQTFIKVESIYLGYILRLRVEFSLNDNILCRHEEWKINVKLC